MHDELTDQSTDTDDMGEAVAVPSSVDEDHLGQLIDTEPLTHGDEMHIEIADAVGANDDAHADDIGEGAEPIDVQALANDDGAMHDELSKEPRESDGVDATINGEAVPPIYPRLSPSA